jgi:trehalose-phosphatase
LHGWEHRPPNGVAVSRWPPDALGLARRQRDLIAARLGEAQGERIEDKGPMVAVHTRNATPERRGQVERVVRDARLPGLDLIEGRRVLELRPLGGPTKGTAVRAIAGSRPAAPVLYVGDDTTDEDAFAVLGPADFGVLVDDTRAHEERPQGSATRARWRVPDTESVLRLLHALAADEAGRRS